MEKNTVGIFANSNNSNENVFFIILVIGVFCILLYLLFRPKKPKLVKSEETKQGLNSKKNVTFVEPSKSENPKEEKKSIINKPLDKEPLSKKENKPLPPIVKEVPKAEEPKVVVKEEEEEETKEKYIGYNPINLFKQTEPLHFPYVMMPKANCVIKFPRKGRTGRKGFKEEAFKEYIDKYFKKNYQVYDDRFVLVANNTKPYEPDFTLINEKEGINLFVDIEIDEPYEGINDIENRNTTHYKNSDTNRNNAFTNRGWIVIRFAEIQVHQQADACCKFIAHVLKSINPQFVIPESLLNHDKIQPILQWTEEEAKKWSLEKYREHYLGIERFGVTSKINQLLEVEETELGEKIEEQVTDDEIINGIIYREKVDKLAKINLAVYTNKYLSFSIGDKKTIFKPTNLNDKGLIGFCYVKNEIKSFFITDLENVEIKDNYYTIKLSGPSIGLDQISNIVNTAIEYDKYIRMKYTRIAWQNMAVDTETGELFIDNIEAEQSIRTVSNVQLSINALSNEHIENYRLNSNYLTAYCHKREEQRTFKFDRIGEIEILDI